MHAQPLNPVERQHLPLSMSSRSAPFTFLCHEPGGRINLLPTRFKPATLRHTLNQARPSPGARRKLTLFVVPLVPSRHEQ
jgi:hypothetical protein